MVRVLILISSMDVGGAETFIMKVFRTIDRSRMMFDFLVSDHKKCFYDDEIKKLGGKIFYGEFKSRHPVKSFLKIYETVKSQHYRAVFRCSEHPMAFLDLLAAKLGGAKVLVIRSTNTSAGGGILSKMLAVLFRPLLNAIATIKIAPSTEAGEWLFGKQKMASGEVLLMHNGVEIDKFSFKPEIRDTLRKELSLDNKFVVGHVGRFNIQKNHAFLLDIFAAIAERRPDAVLMLVGQGELEHEIRNKVSALGLSERVLFMGVRSDVNRLMMAMDVFVFPSLYEGMPNTVIEAQATGLPCVISDTITKEAAITELVVYKSLHESVETWVEQVLSMNKAQLREETKALLVRAGYNISTTSCLLAQSINTNIVR